MTKEQYDKQSEMLNIIAQLVSITEGLAYLVQEPHTNFQIPEGADLEYGVHEAFEIVIYREEIYEIHDEKE